MREDIRSFIGEVTKPGRYTGGEQNSVIKELDKISLRVAFCFPDTYEIGMSNLGMRILTGAFNEMEDVWCERAYAPWPDMEEKMRERGIPLFTLDSGDPVGNFDIVAFTLQYEMCYTNVLNMLDLAGIPVKAAARDDKAPIILAGGPCAYNPEPMADFVDVFSIGEGEEALPELARLYISMKSRSDFSREAFLREASKLDGFYVPSMYEVKYNSDGTIASFEPKYSDVPKTIMKRYVRELDSAYVPTAPVLPYIETVHDRITLEVYRGCVRGCRFCQAGFTNRPVREKSTEHLCALAREIYNNTGYDEISLSSLSISDYSDISKLTEKLLDWTEDNGVSLSLPSLRADSFTPELMERVASVRTSTLTFAPEAGTQRMRDVINKNVTEEEILHAAAIAFAAGKTQVKLYFMIGLPGETDEDVLGIVDVARNVIEEFYKNPNRNKKASPQVTLSVACFIPKPGTPFQWEGQNTREELARKQQLLLKAVAPFRKIRYNYHDSGTSFIEAVFARGDRRLSAAIFEAYRSGCVFDAWEEYFNIEKWRRAFEESGVSPEFYANREFGEDEILPWDMIKTGVDREFLLAERHRAREAATTPSCVDKCSACGAHKFGCGIYCAGSRKINDRSAKLVSANDPIVVKTGDMERDRVEKPENTRQGRGAFLAPAIRTVHITYKKCGDALFIGHLDLVRAMSRALVRSRIPIWYSGGFNPHPKLVFAAPLSVGVGGECELMEIRLTADMSDHEVVERLSPLLPPGIEIISCETAKVKFASIRRYRNRISIDLGKSCSLTPEKAAEMIEKLFSSPLTIMKKSKSGERECDITALMHNVRVEHDGSRVTVLTDSAAEGSEYLNPEYVSRAIKDNLGLPCDDGSVELARVKMLFEGDPELLI